MKLITIQDMLHELSNGNGVSKFLAKISVTADFPMLVTTTTGRILTSAMLPLALRQETQIPTIQNSTDPHRSFLVTEANKYPAYQFLIPGQKAEGYFYILFNEADPFYSEAELIEFGKNVALLLGMEFEKQRELSDVHRQYKETFIFDLLYGNIEHLEDIAAKGLLWGWNLNQPHCVIVFRFYNYNGYTFQYSNMIEEFFNHIQTVISVNGSEAFNSYKNEDTLLEYPLMIKNEDIVLILPVEGKSKIADNVNILNVVSKILKTGQKDLSSLVRVGVGRVYVSPQDIFRSYQEANPLLELGKIWLNPMNFFSNLGSPKYYTT
jgi:hypothetical protein